MKIMYIIRKKLTSDYVVCEDSILIADHDKFRYLKLQGNELVKQILDMLDCGGMLLSDLNQKLGEDGADPRKVSEILEKLIGLEIVVCDYFPDNFPRQKGNKQKVLEREYSNRFGLQIAALKTLETKECSRFEIFEAIQKSEVTIIGAGGIGCNIAVMLAAMGINKLRIIDGDIVEESNLIRQIFFRESDCGTTPKVMAIKRFINEFNSNIEVEAINEFISSEKVAERLLQNSKLIIQTADKPKGKIDRMVSRVCVRNKIPVLFTHNQTVGPIYIPGKSLCFDCFEAHVNQQSKELYSQLIDNMPDTVDSVYPAIVTGPWALSLHLISEILRYLIPNQICKSQNCLISYRNGVEERLPFDACNKCQNCESKEYCYVDL